ncbi:sugar transferase [Microbacterium sp. M28]|uniref:sugar transferase n=1 Tax=Microbacterium sp. M28 TaxID=2962064 RepID=UPI0021F4C97F|nr:sugar transferase [Microbacterium sp. M28]UYO96649.1 sugar transferase [Microbacterium sp. M28]
MTSVEDAVGLTRTATAFAPVAAPRPLKDASRAVVTPRVSATLERRQLWERRYRMSLRVTDAAVIVVAIALTAAAQLFVLGTPAAVVMRDGVLLAAMWFLMLSALSTRAAAVFGSGAAEYTRVAHASGLAFGCLAIVGVLWEWQGLRPLLVIALPVGMLGLLLTRWVWRKWLLQRRREGQYSSRTVVAGDAEDVRYVIDALRRGGETAYHVVGATLFDGNAVELEVDGDRYPVLGNVNTVATVATQLSADTIIVASRPDGDPDFVKQLGWQLEGTASELILSSRLTDVAGPRVSLRQVEGLPLIQVKIPTYEGGVHLLKRALDVVVAVAALVPIALLAPALALIIKADSPGPVFFRQDRVGRDGRTFRMVKFRSMKTDAEQQLAALKEQNEGAGLLFKMKDDPRVTRVGRVLRKLSLDELPQFWNVLIGDMSVVGPRPPLPSEVTAYDGTVYRRLYIKPGITGLWQVSGRSDLTWDESVRLDLRYVENWSVMNDLQIMWRTGRAMVQPKGAY